MKVLEAVKAIHDYNYEIGRVVEIERIAKLLRERAGICFSANQDEIANFYRELAAEFEREAKEKRKLIPPKQELSHIAWDELDKRFKKEEREEDA